MSVLITDADLKQALAAAQSLGKRGITVACLSSNPMAPAFYSRYCKEKIVFKEQKKRNKYSDFLIDLIKKRKYDLIIPCADYSVSIISQIRERIIPHANVYLPSHHKIETVLSKYRLMKLAEQHGVDIPQTFVPKDLFDLKDIESRLKFPIVIKGDSTTGAQKVRYAYSRDELVAKFIEISQIDSQPLIQEYIDGKDKFFYGLCDEGEVTAFFMLEVSRAYPPTGGTPASAFSIYDQSLKEISFKFLKSLKWKGIIDLDFRQDFRTGQYYLLDFNPRFGATIALAIKSGVDFPYFLYKLAVEGKNETISTYSKNTYRSLFREDVFFGLRRPLAIPKLLLEFFQPDVFYGFDRTDSIPFFYLGVNTIKDIQGFICRRFSSLIKKK